MLVINLILYFLVTNSKINESQLRLSLLETINYLTDQKVDEIPM